MTRRADSTATDWHQRFDRGELLASHVRPDGTLLVEGFAAREGILEYRNADGSVTRELVTEKTLLDAAGTLGRAPVTLEHPREDVTPDNVGALGVGDVDGAVRLESGGFVRVQLAVRRRDAISAIQGGKRELSPGYRVRVDATPGTHPVHGPYDAVQTARVYNHLAIVDQARGGDAVRLRADSGDAAAVHLIRVDSDPATPKPQGAARPKGASVNPRFLRLLSLLGVTSRVDSDDAAIEAACTKLEARSDAAGKIEADHRDAVEKLEGEHKTALDTMTAERDTEKARADKAEAEVKALKDAETARVDAAERVALEALATKLDVDASKHTDSKELRKALAAAHLGTELRADASDDYVRAIVDIAKGSKGESERSDGRSAGSDAWSQPAGNAPRVDAQPKPRQTMKNRWSGRPVARGEG